MKVRPVRAHAFVIFRATDFTQSTPSERLSLLDGWSTTGTSPNLLISSCHAAFVVAARNIISFLLLLYYDHLPRLCKHTASIRLLIRYTRSHGTAATITDALYGCDMRDLLHARQIRRMIVGLLCGCERRRRLRARLHSTVISLFLSRSPFRDTETERLGLGWDDSIFGQNVQWNVTRCDPPI